jgi:aryl-alcohol dehydrogenase-like predicted oxidoreductase
VLSRDVVTSVIIGARTESQLEDNLQATALSLSAEELQQLDTATRLRPEYPHWMESMPGDRLPHELSRYE